MIFTCDFCNKTISEFTALYFGFDCLCCSNHCRSQVIKINLQIDPTMNNPHNWFIHKLREKKTKTQLSISKNNSLPDLITKLQV
jgi:hypothetical protein